MVTSVIDGDTIRVQLGGKNEAVRLLGIDAPELRGRNGEAERMASESREIARSLVGGRRVRLETDPEGDTRDAYGRALRYVFLDDAPGEAESLNAELLRRGYARAYTRFPFSQAERYRELENEAREAGRGLWAMPQASTIALGDVGRHIDEHVEVCGPVASARYLGEGRPTFLNLGRPHPNQALTLVIWNTDRDRFDRPEKQFADRDVCVTGTLELYKGRPQIVLRDPRQLRAGETP